MSIIDVWAQELLAPDLEVGGASRDGWGRCQARRCDEVEGTEAEDWAGGRWRSEKDRQQ